MYKRQETYNPRLKTGEIELLVNKLEILSEFLHELPFEIMTSKSVNEETRLKYRYLDMRNEKVKEILLLRSEDVYKRQPMKKQMQMKMIQLSKNI